jgi:tetratricopeptide (TPR) repeat protein
MMPLRRIAGRDMRSILVFLLFVVLLSGCSLLPSDARSILSEGILLMEMGHYSMADFCFRSALYTDSTLDDAWYYRGLSFAEQDDPDAADSCFRRTLALNAVHRPALFMRGQLRLQRDDIGGAMSDFSNLAYFYPALPDGYQGRAWVFERLGEMEKAVSAWGLAIDRERRNPSLYEQRGMAYLRIAMPESAAGDFSRALRLDPFRPRSYAGRGEAYRLLGFYSLSLIDCDSALFFDGEDEDAWLTRGRAADSCGQFEEAITSYRKFLDLVPDSDPDVPEVKERLRRLGR